VTSPSELAAVRARLRQFEHISLGQALIALGLLEPAALEAGLSLKASHPARPLGAILRDLGHVDDEGVRAGLAMQLGVPSVDLHRWPIDPALLSQLPASFARSYRVLPLHKADGILYVAMSDVLDREALEALRFRLTATVEPVYAPLRDIRWAIEEYYFAESIVPLSEEELRQEDPGLADLDRGREEPASISDNVIVRLANQLIAEACRARASDIHIEPAPGHGPTLVRFRVDGRMYLRHTIPWSYRDALVSRLKVMAGMDIADHRLPQDGKIRFRRPGADPVELRIVTMPTAGGVEDVVLRVLASAAALPLETLGLADDDHARLRELIEKPYGILLVCGPTGSGKTTTLHAAVRHLNDGQRKIWTAENPIEITQPGLRQVEINNRVGLTFAAALRSFLRADPDVIMVGEIRDVETARTALEASLTGHLVLSTLHTNTAPESIVRLLEMGMNPFNFADSLLGILAQRLARCLCAECRRPCEADEVLLGRLAAQYLNDPAPPEAEAARLVEGWRTHYGNEGVITLYRATGCEACRNTGYRGRVGLFELMTATPEVRRAIIAGMSAADLFALAQRQGMRTLKQDGIHKVLGGQTDLAQVLAVSQR
jgi:type II secretory ATPase GspE/PulE/Tfp pilus assembly ATPase PilB-like protein